VILDYSFHHTIRVFILLSSETPVTSSINSSSQLVNNGHHSLNRSEQTTKKALLQDIYRPIPKSDTNGTSLSIRYDSSNRLLQFFFSFLFSTPEHHHDDTTPLTGYDNVPHPPEKKKISIPIKKILTKDEPLIENYVNIGEKILFSTKRTALPDDDAPILMPKQHVPMKKSFFKQQNDFNHYQFPPNDNGEEEEDYQPPLPPKQRQNTSRAMVYDFIGSELQELRVALAQFDGNSSSKKSKLNKVPAMQKSSKKFFFIRFLYDSIEF
jgi:hypothetical protein